MKVHCFASVPVEDDTPTACIRQLVRLLRDGAVDSEGAQIELKLVGISERAQTTIQEFQPGRTKGVDFARALAITEELTNLGVAKTKSLNFFLIASGFRWNGSWAGTSARLVLSDGKVLRQKQRFSLTAHLYFEADDFSDASIDQMLMAVASTTGIPFQKDASTTQIESTEPGRAKPAELLLTALSWREILDVAGRTVRDSIDLTGIPHLMTSRQAREFIFDPAKLGKAVRVDFSRRVRKWLKQEFPGFSKSGVPWDGETVEKRIGNDLALIVNIDKPSRPFSKKFTVRLGIALSSPRFAAAPTRPLCIGFNLFELFGIAPLPLQWTFVTEADLLEALAACADVTRRVLAIFEPAALGMQNVHLRTLDEFSGPREVSARQAFDLALPLARAWAQDAAHIHVNLANLSAPCLPGMSFSLPALTPAGSLAADGLWRIRFHSRDRQENLHIEVPSRGALIQSRVDAPHGRHWPSDADQILLGGWMDSGAALSLAIAKAREETRQEDWSEPRMELSSRADTLATKIVGGPMQDGMFAMEQAWRVTLAHRSGAARTLVTVTVPAHGDRPISVEVRAYDKHGAVVASPREA
jgi:hypothetical protein